VTAEPRRRPGETIALRDVRDGRIWAARAATVVRDDEPPLLLFTSAGGRWMAPTGPDGSRLRLPTQPWHLEPDVMPTHVLSFAWPDRRYAVLAIWSADWSFAHWYVNVEDPLRPSAVGFDYRDHVLDAIVEPDRSSWSWKDEDELAEAIDRGIYSADQERAFRTAAVDGVHAIVERRPPFDRDWSDWRPDAAWSVRELPPGWDLVL
jgi:predicted RNA-binding protein associated with RNAse of E/G family